MSIRSMLFVVATSILTGCGSITGFAGSGSKFACKAPDGVTCTSVSGVYANAQQKNLPAFQSSYRTSSVGHGTAAGTTLPVAAAGMPIRSQARVLRIWVAPWRDDDDTLHDQSYMYVMVDPGSWQVEGSREATVRKTMTRLRQLGAPRSNQAAAGTESPPATGAVANVRNDAAAQASARQLINKATDEGETK